MDIRVFGYAGIEGLLHCCFTQGLSAGRTGEKQNFSFIGMAIKGFTGAYSGIDLGQGQIGRCEAL